jgi:hypothetical protein
MFTNLPTSRLDPILDRFEAAWQKGPPCIEDHLPPPGDPDRLLALRELVFIDLGQRLPHGEPVRLEQDYLRRFPELAEDAVAVVGLLVHEYVLRREREPGLARQEYLDRFPQYQAELLAKLPADPSNPEGCPTSSNPNTRSQSPPEPPAAAPPGWPELPDHEILDELGHGGMGVVYKARHRHLKRLVAVKVMSEWWARNPESVARFRREVEAAGRLEHPHLVRATHAGEVNGTPYLVMELLDGTDLAQLVRQHGPWPVSAACEAVRQAARGLQHAHEQGLVHRDVKPSNLLLTTAGVVKVLDLGLARLREVASGEELTNPGETMGTADFMAPEQILDSHTADVRADLYSLGCTLFHLLTGGPPFGSATHPTLAAKRAAHLNEPAPDVRSRRPDVPEEVAAAIRRLLAKRPEDRYATAAVVAEVLEPFTAGVGLERMLGGKQEAEMPAAAVRSDHGEPAPVSASPVRRESRRRWLALAGSLLLAAGLALAIWAWPDVPSGTDIPVRAPSGTDIPVRAPAPPALTIRTFRVFRYQDLGDNHQWRGELGDKTFQTRLKDLVQLEAELTKPAYAYLLAFNPGDMQARPAFGASIVGLLGSAPGPRPLLAASTVFPGRMDQFMNLEQLCYPPNEQMPPERMDRLKFPKARKWQLDDGVGLQAFVLVASRQPLPAYAVWRPQRPAITWKRMRATSGIVWRGDGERLDRLLAPGDGRGREVGDEEETLLEGLGHELRAAPGIEAVALIAFAVDRGD